MYHVAFQGIMFWLFGEAMCMPATSSQFFQPKNGKRTHVKIKLCECETDQCGCGEF